jgi:serine/threonine-protein kinase
MTPMTPSGARFGSYELVEQIASGGMGTIHVAHHVGAGGIERLVVVKRIHPHLLTDPALREMFRDEARVSVLVRHPNVVHVLDVIESAGELCLVLEYVESISLATLSSAVTREGRRMPPPIAAKIVGDSLGGLHAAHEAVDVRGEPLHLVHRDVSPQNILVGCDGISRIIDFGIAKAVARVTETTGAGVLKGKPAYMSPEQVRGVELDRRSDVFSAGVVLHELLTGRRLFQSERGDVRFVDIMLGAVDPPSRWAPDVPPALDDVVARALEPVRDDRFQTAASFQEVLASAISPASTRDVKDFVEQCCAQPLTERRRRIQTALAGSKPSIQPGSIERGTETTELATPSIIARLHGKPQLRRGLILGATLAAGVVLVAGVQIVKAMKGRGQSAPPPQESTVTAPPPPASAATVTEAPSAADPEPSGIVAPSHATVSRPPSRRSGAKPRPSATGGPSPLHPNPYPVGQ